jgi:hypothetical protein
LIIPAIAIVASFLLPLLSFIWNEDTSILFYTALGAGSLGSILLFFTRLPLNRQRRFGLLARANFRLSTANFIGWRICSLSPVFCCCRLFG